MTVSEGSRPMPDNAPRPSGRGAGNAFGGALRAHTARQAAAPFAVDSCPRLRYESL